MRVLLVIALAACSTACSADRRAGPAWPKLSIGEPDGGESLAPRPPARAIAIVDDDPTEDDAADDPPVADDPPAAATPAAVDPPAAALAAPDSEEPITLEEEIVIEVEVEVDD